MLPEWTPCRSFSALLHSDKPVVVRYAGTGAMLISVEKVLKPLAEAHPERRYRANVAYDKKLEWSFDYFRCGIRGENYLGEDYFFLEDVKSDLKILPHIIPSARTLHAGVQIFELNTRVLWRRGWDSVLAP